MKSIAQLKWQCRRGTKELDYLLEGYLFSFYEQSTNQEKNSFNELLEMQDSYLIEYLLGSHIPNTEGLSSLVKKIREND